MYIRDGRNYAITASNNGAEEQPDWFWNLKAKAQTTIEVDYTTVSVTTHRASIEEKGRLWPQWVEKAPFFESYRKKTERDIPMMILQPAADPERPSVELSAAANHPSGGRLG